MASAELSRRVEKVVGYAPLSERSGEQRREFHEALFEALHFEDLPGKWQRRQQTWSAEGTAEKFRMAQGEPVTERTRCVREPFSPAISYSQTAWRPRP